MSVLKKVPMMHVTQVVVSVLVLMGLLGATVSGGVLALPLPLPSVSGISGSVMINSTPASPALGAVVEAFQGSNHQSVSVASDGSYQLGLAAGDWTVTVKPPAPTTLSPTWVFSGQQQAATVAASGYTTVSFQVDPAPGVISGQLSAPGGASFNTAGSHAWVRAADDEGDGNTVQVDAAGNFSVNVLPGNTHLRLILENPSWAPPAALSGSEWYVDGVTPVTVDPALLTLQVLALTITGTVQDITGGSPTPFLTATPVDAVRLDGSDIAHTMSDPATGAYTLHVAPGMWAIRAAPLPPATLAAAWYVPAEPPVVRAVLASDLTGVDLTVAKADRLIQGNLVDGGGNPVTGVKGHAWATYHQTAPNRWLQLGSSAVINPVTDQFLLPVAASVSSSYRIRLSLDPASGYGQGAPVDVNLASTTANPIVITVPVLTLNSHIQGDLINSISGLAQTGLPGVVFAAGNTGAFAHDKVNPVTGSYDIPVATTDELGSGGTFWWVHAFVDPITKALDGNHYVVMSPRAQKVFLPYNSGAGSTANVNFTVAQVNAVIGGHVTYPDGVTPAAGVRVTVKDASGGDFHSWTLTGKNGNYLLAVPAGTYTVKVYGFFPLDSVFNPPAASVSVAANKGAVQDFRFIAWDQTTITGQVTYNSQPHAALVRGYSDHGAQAATLAGSDGSYTLKVLGGATWHVQAVSSDGSDYLASKPAKVVTTAGQGFIANLNLVQRDTLPESQVFNFDASQDQTLTLSNGAQVIIPAGAMGDSGPITVIALPLADLVDDGGAQPVSFGYRLLAYNTSDPSNPMPVTHFASSVTLEIPFTAAQLQALGVSPSQLIPSYWDQGSNSWAPLTNYSISLDPTTGNGMVIVNVDHFTDFATVAPDLPVQTWLPVMVH